MSRSAFIRTIATPRAGLVVTADVTLPGDWPIGESSVEANLGHALGWTVEVRRNDLLIMNPLGEGVAKTSLPDFSTEWLTNVRRDGSCAVYLAQAPAAGASVDEIVAASAGAGTLRAATVRSAIADDYGAVDPVGRNQPCPCGSGKKFKHCHG